MLDRLRLRARDPEDLEAMAACLQDALVRVGAMRFMRAEKRFAIVANRFRWEIGAALEDANENITESEEPDEASFEESKNGMARPLYERVHCGLCFDRVVSVRSRKIDRRARDQILSLLTIVAERNRIFLIFAGGGEIELTVEALRGRLDDLGEAWPTRWRPRHRQDEGDGAGE